MAQKTRISISKEWREWFSRHIQYVTLATAPLECRSGARLLCSSQQSSLIAVTFVHRKKGAGGNYNVLRNHHPDLFPLSSSELINLPLFFSFLPFHLRAPESHKTAHLGARGGSGREVSVIQTVPSGHLL